MSKFANSLQKSIYEKLSSSSELELIIGVGKIIDHHIINKEYPYISITNWRAIDWSTDSESGEDIQFDIDIWDDQASQKQLKDISSLVTSLLHDQVLDLDVGTLVNLRFENVFFQNQGGTKLQSAKLRFRAKIEN